MLNGGLTRNRELFLVLKIIKSLEKGCKVTTISKRFCIFAKNMAKSGCTSAIDASIIALGLH